MKRKNCFKNLLNIFIFLIVIIWVFPIFWIFINSFRSSQAIIAKEITLLFKPTFEHYRLVFSKYPFLHYLINSVAVAVFTTIISVLSGSLAAYSLARFNTGGMNYALWVISSRMLPPAVLIIPFYLMFKTLGILNTWYVLIIAYTTFNLSFVVLVMKGFFEEVPSEIEEAALIDGASRIGTFFRIAIPLAKPGIIACSIFCLIFSWNEFLFALILSVAKGSKTLPVAAGDFITGYAVNWGPLFAAGVIILTPVIVFTLIVQRYITRGLTLGAIK